MKEKLLGLIEEIADVHPVTCEMTFDELGLDSLDFAQLLSDIRWKIGKITDKDAIKCATVGDLLAHISA